MRSLRFVLLFVVAASALIPAFAQEAATPTPKLKVGLFDRPPFAMKNKKGEWEGIAVELWESIAEKTRLPYEYVETPLDHIIGDLAEGKLDVAVGELGVTAERERIIDFTQPYLDDPAAVAFHKGSRYPSFREVLDELTQHGLVRMVVIMAFTLFIFSIILWLCERRVHQTHFGGKPIHGLGSAIWFGAVTMTTVGYGDKTPQSVLGRSLALLWMFISIILVAVFTASVTASITVARINGAVKHPADLEHFVNGVQSGSIGEELLKDLGIRATSYETLEAGLQALSDKKITAFVADSISMRYIVRQHFGQTISITPFTSVPITFGIGTRPNLPQFNDINDALLEIREKEQWRATIKRWLGSTESVNL